MDAWYFYLIMIAAGFAAGFINTLAGSGSILTLPLLMYLGLPANIANATNRIGIVLQNATGTATFYRTRMLDIRKAIILGIPAVLGSIIGASIAVSIDEATMRVVIGIAMVIMSILIILNSDRWLIEHIPTSLSPVKWWHLGLMLLIGVYGGFIQLGVGIFLLITLVMTAGFDTRHANAIKVAVIFLFNIAALLVFQGGNQINWGMGLIVAVGSMLGAWVGARYAIHWKPKWIFGLLICILLITAMDLLGILSWFGSLIAGRLSI